MRGFTSLVQYLFGWVIHLFVIGRDVRWNGRLRNDEIQDFDSLVAESLNADGHVGPDVPDDVEEHGVVDLVDGVVGTEDAELLADSVEHQGVLELHAVLADQVNQLLLVHVGNHLEK